MNTDTYVIREDDRLWCLELNGERLGTFDERTAAERAAQAAARMSRRRGRPAEVLVYDGKGTEEANLVKRLTRGGGLGAALFASKWVLASVIVSASS